MRNFSKRDLGIALLVAAVLVAALAIWAVLDGDDAPSAGSDGESLEYGARGVCEEYVKDRLKSPGSAEFSEARAVGNGDHVGSIWKVEGAVDSENSYGGLVRSEYVCRVEYGGNERWTLIDTVSLDERR